MEHKLLEKIDELKEKYLFQDQEYKDLVDDLQSLMKKKEEHVIYEVVIYYPYMVETDTENFNNSKTAVNLHKTTFVSRFECTCDEDEDDSECECDDTLEECMKGISFVRPSNLKSMFKDINIYSIHNQHTTGIKSKSTIVNKYFEVQLLLCSVKKL
jgi:hypothetical protein